MSLSPQLDPAPRSPPIAPAPHTQDAAHSSNAQLATLLTDSFRETEALRRDLAAARKRADRAEHLLQALQHLANPPPPDPSAPDADPAAAATRLILEYEERTQRAEAARDEADARRRLVLDNWQQLDRYLASIELRAADARLGFSRIVADGGGPLVLTHIPVPGARSSMLPPAPRPASSYARSHGQTPVFPPLSLPPPPVLNQTPTAGSRRPRAGSLDMGSGQPPSKKPRGRERDGDERRGRDERSSFTESVIQQHLSDPREREYLEQQQQQQRLQYQRHERQQAHQLQIQQQQQQQPSQPRMILPPGAHRPRSHSASRSRSRSSSRSSSSSLSLDEMLLRATTTGDDKNPNNPPAAINGTDPTHLEPPRVRHRRSSSSHHHHQGQPHHHHQRPSSSHAQQPPARMPGFEQQPPHHLYQQQHVAPPSAAQGQQQRPSHPDSPPYPQQQQAPFRARASGASTGAANTGSGTLVPDGTAGAGNGGPLTQPGQVQTYQTHIFAPVVTGAPIKKTKYGGGGTAPSLGSIGPIDAPPPVPPPQFPPTNAQGQRICRQCGLSGRYKDGKCVEKWGPGPMGPGTVCDRCRKKMKRVERRGTLETQQLASSNSIASIAALQQQQQSQQQQQQQYRSPPHRTSSSHAQLSQSSDRSVGRGDTLLNVVGQQSQGQQQQLGPGGTHLTFPSSSSASLGHGRHGEREREEGTIRGPHNNGNGNGHAHGGMHASTTTTTTPAAPSMKHHRHPPSPPPIASLSDEIPTSNVGRAGSRAQSRSGSRTRTGAGAAAAAGGKGRVGGLRPTPPGFGGADPSLKGRSPLGSSGSGSGGKASVSPGGMDVDGGEGDADGDADVDADADAEMDGVVDELGGHGRGEKGLGEDGEGDVDAEADLLEAVDAAEANSNGGSSVGGGWLKSEDM